MNLDDVRAVVRDNNGVEAGQLDLRYCKLLASDTYCNVGEWQVEMPTDYPLLPILTTPGAGLNTMYKGSDGVERYFLTGPMDSCRVKADKSNPAGLATVHGIGDSIIFADRRCYVDIQNAYPGQNNEYPGSTQTFADYLEINGAAEYVMFYLVIGNTVPNDGVHAGLMPPARANSTIYVGTYNTVYGVTDWRQSVQNFAGPTVTYRAAFEPLGEALLTLARTAGVGFRVRHNRAGLALFYESFSPVMRTDIKPLSIEDNDLSSVEVGFSAPYQTQVFGIGGYVTEPTSTTKGIRNYSSWPGRYDPNNIMDPTQGERFWRRRIESTVNAQNTSDSLELQRLEARAWNEHYDYAQDKNGTQIAGRVELLDDARLPMGVAWNLGDTLPVKAPNGSVLNAQVTGATIRADETGVRLGMTLGDLQNLGVASVLPRRVQEAQSRLTVLETRLRKIGA